MNLYELAFSYQNLINLAEETDSDFSSALDELSDSIEVKVENIAKVVKSLEAQAEAFRVEEKRLAERRKSIENNIKRLKTYTEESMLALGKEKIKGQLFTMAIQNNPQSVEVINEAHIPEGFWTPQPPKLNRRELLEELKLGHEIEGVEIKQTRSLRIR